MLLDCPFFPAISLKMVWISLTSETNSIYSHWLWNLKAAVLYRLWHQNQSRICFLDCEQLQVWRLVPHNPLEPAQFTYSHAWLRRIFAILYLATESRSLGPFKASLLFLSLSAQTSAPIWGWALLTAPRRLPSLGASPGATAWLRPACPRRDRDQQDHDRCAVTSGPWLACCELAGSWSHLAVGKARVHALPITIWQPQQAGGGWLSPGSIFFSVNAATATTGPKLGSFGAVQMASKDARAQPVQKLVC